MELAVVVSIVNGIILRSSTITSANGDITFTGTGSGDGTGIQLSNNDLVESTGTGKVSLTGTGGNGIGGSTGIFIANNGLPIRSKVLSKDGDITLTGKAPGIGDDNTGITILGLVESTGIGKVTLNGVGGDGNGNKNNQGIFISFPGKVLSSRGDITFTGTGKGSGNNNTGIADPRAGGIKRHRAEILLSAVPPVRAQITISGYRLLAPPLWCEHRRKEISR